MYLKSLTLKGFKSFADRTRMVFDPGLTVVVGPNGSGKSNISDAILWVLGEQSAKHLRGSAMEDVIFAGSSGRAAVSVAEVDLVLDNSDHTLPVDFNEVAITRRMYRSGESEYLLNASPARLLDIQDILHDSGLGRQTHSIISQGKLDAILMSRPEDRRALVEEAAGISKHKRRKERSLRKLESMDAYLKRAQDLERTLTRQLKPLERQVEQTRRYTELTNRFDELSISLAVDDLRRLKASWEEVLQAESAARKRLESSEQAAHAAQRELDALQAALDEQNEEGGDLSEQLRRVQALSERLNASTRLLEEKGRHMVGRLSELYDAICRSEARLRDCTGELEQARVQSSAAQEELAGLEKEASRASVGVQEARTRRRQAESALEDASSRARSLSSRRNEGSLALAKARDALENARTADDMHAERLSQIEQAWQRASADLEAARAACSAGDAALEQAKAAAQAFDGRLSAARDQLSARTQELANARNALAQAQAAERAARSDEAACAAEATGLERAARNAENRDPLAAHLAADATVASSTLARVSEVLEVPGELADLVETLLDERASGFVVRGERDFARVAERAHEHASAAGRVSVVRTDAYAQDEDLPAESQLQGYALLSRIGVPAGFEGAAQALLGDVRVVDTFKDALAASENDKTRLYATPHADVVRAGALATIGRPASAAHGLVATRTRLRELRAQQAGLSQATEAACAACAQAQRALEDAQTAQEAAAQEVAQLTSQRASALAEVDRAGADARRALAERDRLEGSLVRLVQQQDETQAKRDAAHGRVAELQATIKACEADLETLAAQICALEADLGELTGACDEAKRADRAAHEKESACTLALTRVREQLRYAQERCARLEAESEQITQGLAVSRASEAAFEVMSRRVEPLHARHVALAEIARDCQSLVSERREAFHGQSLTLRQAVEGARARVAQAQGAYTDALSGVSEVKVRKGRLDVQVNTAVAAIASRKGVILEEALELPAPVNRAADEAELARLEKALGSLGAVNHVAIEEYDALRARVDFVAGQVADLQHARSSLAKIIAAIDRKMRSSFLTTFDAVNVNFQEMFAALFPGGSGRLELTDPDNPDETGIEVIAQPRGKRVTKMSLLSGGERSLAALGLLFAVYKTRTVPFYVLDEVEAALDDSNLDRLLAAIDLLRERTQLIVISHQRRTMERADVLYGVSMQADGVSKVVSQRLSDIPPAAYADAQ